MPLKFVGTEPFYKRGHPSIAPVRSLLGIHDPGGEWIFENEGATCWVVYTIRADQNPNGVDISRQVDRGHPVIMRVNWNYFPHGTIPLPERYPEFAGQVFLVAAHTPACHIWIIGNEMNHVQERPYEQPITPESYRECFERCRDAITGTYGHADDIIMPGAVSVWYPPEPLGYLEYQYEVLRLCQPNGVASHVYSRGSDPASITDPSKMDPNGPYAGLYSGFQAWRDLRKAIPTEMSHLPVFITETNQYGPWDNSNTGWVRAAHREIRDNWSEAQCLALYRWPNADQWGFADKGGVHEDIRETIRKDYQ